MIEMFGSVVIDVVIALALVFTLFSLITSGLREVVAWVFRTRSKELWHTIRGLLEDPITNAFRPLRTAVLAQPGNATTSGMSTIDVAEQDLRDERDRVTTADQWTAVVDRVTTGLADQLEGLDQAAASITSVNEGLKKAYSKHDTNPLKQAWLAIRRGGSVRPRVPAVPNLTNVASLAESVRSGVRSFTDAVYDHPVVRQIDRTGRGRRSRLTSLDAGDLSEAAISLIQNSGVEALIEGQRRALAAALSEVPEAPVETSNATIAALSSRVASGTSSRRDIDAVFSRLRAELGGAAARVETQVSELRARLLHVLDDQDPLDLIETGLDALENIGPVRETVASVAVAVRHAETEARDQVRDVAAGIGAWYDEQMEAASGWYRKRSRVVGFLLALVVVIGFNVDAINIPRELWHNETAREAVVALADSSGLGTAGCTTEEGEVDPACVEANVERLIDTGLPLGWVGSGTCGGECSWFGERLAHSAGASDGFWDGVLWLLGWALAAAALTMGASFWFDIFRRITGIKSTLKGTTTADST